MQEKFAIKSSNKTGQIKSISKYEMLYMPKAIPAKRIHLNHHFEPAIDANDLSGSRLYSDAHGQQVNRIRSTRNQLHCAQFDQIIRPQIIGRVARFCVTLACLWWIGSVGFVDCADSGGRHSVIQTNASVTEKIKWPLLATARSPPSNALHVDATRQLAPSNNHAMQAIVRRERIRQSLSSILILNVLISDKNSEHHSDDQPAKSNGSTYEQHQRQQFGISIITRSKKTNPNASFSLDLFRNEHVQRQNTTLNSLNDESDRIPDAIRKSLHRHHSVIKQFRALVTKRYHFTADTKDDSNHLTPRTARTTSTTTTTDSDATNERPTEPPLKHLIYVLTAIDHPDDTQKTVQRIANIDQNAIELASIRSSKFNGSTAFLRAQQNPVDANESDKSMAMHSNHKRSTDLQIKPAKPTKHPFDDHFFNSKLQNYYFLYQIDNISNYNNHFDLLNSPNNYNATQLKLNKQSIQFFNRQINNALMDATESDFTKYNRIKRILLAKIASVCANCVDNDPPVRIYILPRSLPVAEMAAHLPAPLAQLAQFPDAIERRANGTQKLVILDSVDNKNQSDWDSNADKDKEKDKWHHKSKTIDHKRWLLFPFDAVTMHNLKNYPRIAGLLSNLSLAKVSDQATINFSYRNQNIRTPEAYGVENGADATGLNAIHEPIDNGTRNRQRQRSTLVSHVFQISNITNHVDKPICAKANISNYNYSPISRFEHYIRIIRSRNINNRNNYYAMQTDVNKSNLSVPHSPANFKRVKEQKQIIKLFTTNHRFILKSTTGNNINGSTVDGHATDTNIVKDYKLNFTLNESNCTIKVLNLNGVNAKAENVDRSVVRVGDHDKNKDSDGKSRKMVVTTVKRHTNVNQMTESIQIAKSSKVKRNRPTKANKTRNKSRRDKDKSKSSNSNNSYLMRLESIKYQILMKLGLKQKPNITNILPKHVIMETLYRAEDTNMPQSSDNLRNDAHRKQHRPKHRHKQKHKSKSNKHSQPKISPPIIVNEDPNVQVYHFESHQFSTNEQNGSISDENFIFNSDSFDDTNDVEFDDFYGRTREIIIFAEKGSYFNHQPLIEFVSTNGLDESATSNSANSIAVETSSNHTSYESDKLKSHTKCKGVIIDRQVRKRKRRRRQIDDASKTVRSKPAILVSDEKQVHKETVMKSTSETIETHYQPSNLDSYGDGRVRRAFLWIKVDEVIKHKKGSPGSRQSNKIHKSKANRQRKKFRGYFRLWVFRINEASTEQNEHIKLSASKSIHVSRLGWQKLDVTATVRQWYAYSGKSRLRFLVDCSGCADRIKIHLFDGKPTKSSHARAKPNLLQNDKINGTIDPVRPFLVIYTDPHVIKRVRRHTPDCSVAVRGQCCKQKFYVSFAELGWEDWIIAPHGYYANYCQGNCNGLRTPDNFRSYHSHVIEEYRKMNRLTGLQPCCTPLKFSSMSLIYYEENQKIIKRDLPKMVVDECGCP